MAFSAPFSAPQMDWETNDSILAFGKFKQKCELMFSKMLKVKNKSAISCYGLASKVLTSITVGHLNTEKIKKTQRRFLIDLWNIWSHRQIIKFTGILYKVCDKTKVSQSIILLPRLRISQSNASSVAMKNSRIDY
jgi:hypothetical protein